MYDKFIDKMRMWLAAIFFVLFVIALLGIFYLICIIYVGVVNAVAGFFGIW